MKSVTKLTSAFLLLAGTAAAQMTITNVTNAGANVTFGDASPGNYFDPGRYTVTGSGKDVGAFTASTDVPATPFVWTNIPNAAMAIDRSKDLTVTWTGGIPNTQVTVFGASTVNGVTSVFLCAAPVSAGTITIPSFVLLQLLATGASVVPSRLGAENSSVSTFTASGLDVATIRYTFRLHGRPEVPIVEQGHSMAGTRMPHRAVTLLTIFLLGTGAQAATTTYAATNVGPYRSTDGGVTWQSIKVTVPNALLQGVPDVVAIAVDPANPAKGLPESTGNPIRS